MITSNKNYLSIDIGGTFIKHALIDQSGNIQSLKKDSTPNNLEPFKELIVEILDSYHDKIRAVAVSCPGKIDSTNGIVYHGGALPFLHTFKLKEFIETHTQLTCSLTNDGKSAALAELWLGQLKDIKNGGVMTLGTGVGGGLVLNGELFQGTHFQAAELSFMLLTTDSPLDLANIAGLKGSAVNFIQQAATLLQLDNLLDGKTVFYELEKRNPLIYPLFEAYSLSIATIIMNIQSVVDLERIAIGGGISAQPILIEEINEQYHKTLTTTPLLSSMLTPVEIVPCHFRNEAGLLGALYQLLQEVDEHNFNNGKL